MKQEMKAQMSIKNAEGQEVPLGEVILVEETIPFASEHGRTSAGAVQFEFRRLSGQHSNDPADDVIFGLVAGKGRGEVIETTATVVYRNPRSLAEVGTLVLERANVH